MVNQLISLFTSISRKGELFITPDRPASEVKRMLSDESPPREKNLNYWASIWMLFRIVFLIGFIFISTEISMFLHVTGIWEAGVICFTMVLFLLLLLGIEFAYARLTSLIRKRP